jgi:tRNA A-37 threonylcarbamoyl transferase component Bud32/tetratricopeptide (TPR) repeat protein
MTGTRPTPEQLEALTGGRYLVERLLAEGGMGAVYVARNKSLGHPVAIKILPPDVATSEVRMARFRREAALAAHLSHPNIVQVYEFDVADGVAYLVMPLIQGETLDERLRREGPLPVHVVREMVRQVGAALAFAHARGVVHRDVKPSNILHETATGRWLLTDFGVARGSTASDTAITATGIAVGTPAYMAPEQAAGRVVDARADLFAMASVAYEALTGMLPSTFDPETAARQLAENRSDLALRLARSLMQPLAAAPEQRPASVDHWLDDLNAAERRSGFQPWAAALALAAAAITGWIALQQPPQPVRQARSVAVLPFTVSGAAARLALDSVLSQGFVWQLQGLSELRVLSTPAVRRALVRGTGGEMTELDTVLAVAREIGADLAVIGRAEVSAAAVRLSIRVHDTGTFRVVAEADTSGPADSLHMLVSELVVEAFAADLAGERAGWARPTLPRGLPAIAAYFQGDRDFRRGDYENAIAELDRVVALDSTYAPAYFKRMLALAQLNPGETQLRSALRAVDAYADRLDPVSRQLLQGYDALVRRGDLQGAERAFRDIVTQNPDAVDAWFSLGELQFHFAPLLGAPLSEAEATFQEVVQRDPTFAPAIAHLVTLAVAREDDDAARTLLARYLQIDSTSAVADLARAADTLLFRPERTGRIVASFPRRPRAFLENIAFLAAEFGRSAAERDVGLKAVDALWQRAGSRPELERAFRMRMAVLLGSGRDGSAARFLQDASSRNVPRDELDRWTVLSGITAIPDLAGQVAMDAAAMRLAATGDTAVVNQWLAARWFRIRDPDRAADIRQRLRRLEGETPDFPPIFVSLLEDLDAYTLLAAHDTAGALETWRRATERFSVELVPFELVASLWPLRLSRARNAEASRRYTESLEASASFVRIAGFADQAAWPQVLPLRAEAALALGDTALALNTYRDLLQTMTQPNGQGVETRQRVVRALERLGERGEEGRGGERRGEEGGGEARRDERRG